MSFFPQKPETTYDTTILYNGVKSGVSFLFITRGRAKMLTRRCYFMNAEEIDLEDDKNDESYPFF